MTIPSFRKGQKLAAADLQSLADAVRANRVLPGFGIRITGSPNGTTVALAKKRGGGPGSPLIHPFQAIAPSPYEGEGEAPKTQALKFKVRPGIVSSWGSSAPLLPSNLNEEFTAPGDAEQHYCWLDAHFVSNNGFLSLTALEYGNGEELPESEFNDDEKNAYPTRWCLPLFSLKTEEGAIKTVNQFVMNSLSLTMVANPTCGGVSYTLFWSAL